MARVKELHINGKALAVDADAERSLLSVLREELDLTGAKYGCGEGQCGACTVLLDGVAVHSCLTKVGSVGSRKVLTIEGLESNGRLHPLQQAFLDTGAMQCAYCTSGMIMSGYSLLSKKSNPTEPEIVRAMNGNICRCGAYQRIVNAVKLGSKSFQKVEG